MSPAWRDLLLATAHATAALSVDRRELQPLHVELCLALDAVEAEERAITEGAAHCPALALLQPEAPADVVRRAMQALRRPSATSPIPDREKTSA